MSETYELLKEIEFGYQYQVNCELTPEQCKRILDWYEKWHKCQSLACKQEARIAELEERNDELSSIDEMLSETVENMRETIVSLTVGDSVEFDLHCPKCGDDIRQMLHANPIEGEHEYELLNRIAELEEQLLKVSKEYAEMSFARRVNKHNETIRDSR